MKNLHSLTKSTDLWHLGIPGEPPNAAFPSQCPHVGGGISLREPGEAMIPNPDFGSGAVFPPGLASGAFPLRSRGNTRVEEACEMYTRAANMFKIAKNWSGESKSWDLGVASLIPGEPGVPKCLPVSYSMGNGLCVRAIPT